MHKNTKATKRFWIKNKSLALQEEGCTTLGPTCLVTTARHVETCDCPVTISIVIDWDGDAFARWIGVSGILQRNKGSTDQVKWPFKDGAYYCYCAYILRIFRYSDFLSPMLTNTGIFLRGLKLSGESRS